MKHIQKRLFLGNLPPNISKRDVVHKLQDFGHVLSAEMKQRADDDGNIMSSFAFVDIEIDTDKLYTCFRRFQSEPWGDRKIKVEIARESFLDRLKREQEEAKRSDSKDKKCDLNGNLGQNHSQVMVDSITYKNREESKDHSASCIKSEEKVDKKNSKASKKRKDLTPKPVSGHDISVRPEEEKKDDLEIVDANHEKRTHKRLGVLSMFSGAKNSKNVNDSESNVQDYSSKDSSQDLEDKIKKEDEEERQFRGSLPMFSGTRNLMGLSDSDKMENDSRNKKRSAEVLSSPAKKRKSESFKASTEKQQLQAIDDATSIERAGGKNKFSKEKDDHSEEKKKKKSNTDKKAEEKRLHALEERNKAIHLQKEAVKKALSSVDVKTNPNKIIFDDEDSEDDEKVTPGADSLNDQIMGPSKPKLFEDSSDDEDLEDMRKTEFKIKPQFEGQKGQKLLEMQSRYGNDTRFNLDERFLESDGESGPEEVEEEDGDEKEEDLNVEKARQLSILQEMLGINVSTKSPRKEVKEKRKPVEMVRFDPSNPEHNKYLVNEVEEEKDEKKEAEKEQKKSKKKKKEEEEENVEEERKVPTSTERFYEVSDLLKESLKKKTEKSEDSIDNDAAGSKGFSLLKAFGSAPSDSEKDEEEVESYSTRPIKGGLHEWDKNPFKYDSSDEEEEEMAPKHKEITSDKVPDPPKTGDPPPAAVERFHLREDDPRLEEGLAFFRVDKTFEEMKEGFQEKRTDLKSIIKAKLRNNKKKKLPFRKKLGGLRRKFPKGRR